MFEKEELMYILACVDRFPSTSTTDAMNKAHILNKLATLVEEAEQAVTEGESE